LVANFVREHGLTVVEKSPSQRTVIASGTVANLNKAFGVELGRYEAEAIIEKPRRPPRPPEKVPAEKPKKAERTKKKEEKAEKTVYVGYAGYVHIPQQLANVVEAVFGLDRRRSLHPSQPCSTSGLRTNQIPTSPS
jgi:kumamolisin